MFKFQKLVVWERSIELADDLLSVAEKLPRLYQFSLGDQLRRAVISIPTNIAEGSGRRSEKESANFYNREIFERAEEIARMVSGLIKVNS